MDARTLFIELSVSDTVNLLVNNLSSILVDKKLFQIENKEIAVLIYEKYFLRTNSSGALVIIIENTNGKTCVRINTAGCGQGMLGVSYFTEDSLVREVISVLTHDGQIGIDFHSDVKADEFETMYFENVNKYELDREVEDFIRKNKIELLDKLEDMLTEKQDEETKYTYTVFITYKKQ